MDKLKPLMQAAIYKDTVNTKINTSLPKLSTSPEDILSLLNKWSKYEKELWDGTKKYSSGAIYHGDNKLISFQNEIEGLFAISNPLHPTTFPFVRKMLSEIIGMTITYFNGNPYEQCGLLTSGGTESICCAIRSYKNYAKYKWFNNNNTKSKPFLPELIIPITGHAAFHKACEMYEIKIILLNVDNNTYKVNPDDIELSINCNTIGIVSSAPDYAHGIIDDIDIISEIAYKYSIPFHVDCCLGSFLLSTISKLDKYKYNIPKYDWRCRGVTTISCDTHKFGFAIKGTSVLMFKNNELRRHSYFIADKTTIGLYCTPTILGSKNGAVIASCWATMMYFGENGYIREAEKIMNAVEYIKYEIINNNKINKYICIMGNPLTSVICWKLTDLLANNSNIHVYNISDAMSLKGWGLNNCTSPACTHLCVTVANCNGYKKFINDLIISIQDVLENVNTNKYKNTAGAIYGTMIETAPDYLQDDYMKTYLDVINDLPPIKSNIHSKL